jgi:uncharacterized membrane protein YoaK (UPF0700 family)
MSPEAKYLTHCVSAPSVDASLGTKLLPFVLSVIAGSTDVISFLGLGGLFTAHITGNLVILAAHVVSGGVTPLAPMLSVPIFIIILGLTRLSAAGLETIGLASLRPLLLLQFLLLAAFLALSVAAGPHLDPDAATAIVAGMCGVSAMAVQNTLVNISLKGAPSTAVMTTNITRLTMDVGEVLVGRDRDDVAKARNRAKHTWPAVVGFVVGCGLGAWCEAVTGLGSLALPTGLGLFALLLGLATKLDKPQAQPPIASLVAETSPQRPESHRASASGTASNAGRA